MTRGVGKTWSTFGNETGATRALLKRATDPDPSRYVICNLLMTLLSLKIQGPFLYTIVANHRDVQLRIGCRQQVMLNVYRDKFIGNLSFIQTVYQSLF